MDKDLAIHEIAITAAKMFVENNMPQYSKARYPKLVEDLVVKYNEAYQRAEETFSKLNPPSKIGINILKPNPNEELA